MSAGGGGLSPRRGGAAAPISPDLAHAPAPEAASPPPPSRHALWALAAALGACNAAWAVKTNAATPVLRKLGVDVGDVGYARLAGPITGALVQPLAGSLMDASAERRRPMLIVGAVALAAGLVYLSQVRTDSFKLRLFGEFAFQGHGIF